MSITFPVSKVGKKNEEGYYTPGGYTKPQLMELKSAFKSYAKNRGRKAPEAVGGPAQVLYPYQADGLFTATHTAFEMHLGLELAPDHIWLTIARQVAKHITDNAEELRKKFVDHEGQEYIEIRRDDFVKGHPENPWPEAFAEFSEQIGKRIKVDKERFLCNFSTTTPLEKAASEVILMDAMSKYFKYGMMTCCGIPEITLRGEVSDWEKIVQRVGMLAEWGLEAWVSELLPVVTQFAVAAGGQVDTEWWQSFYKYQSMSGGDTITGHITKLYKTPAKQERSYLNQRGEQAMTSSKIEDQVSFVPFIWKYYGQEIKMQFWAGLPFATIENGVCKPMAAWAVAEAP